MDRGLKAVHPSVARGRQPRDARPDDYHGLLFHFCTILYQSDVGKARRNVNQVILTRVSELGSSAPNSLIRL